jgi:hypothetical protein
MLRLTLILSLVVVLFSCTDDYSLCTESRTVQFSSFFYRRVGGQEVTANAPNLRITDASTNQEIFSNQPNVSSFSLVLNPTVSTMKFYISLSPTLQSDTLTVNYTSSSKSLSPECGVISVHQILSATTTKHTLDTVKLTNAIVDNGAAPNSKIIF